MFGSVTLECIQAANKNYACLLLIIICPKIVFVQRLGSPNKQNEVSQNFSCFSGTECNL